MLDHQKVKEEIIKFIGNNGLKMISKFYKEKKTPFPLIVEDNIPISINFIYGRSIRNYINEKFNIVPNEINDWGTYEDYIYNLVIEIIKEYEVKR